MEFKHHEYPLLFTVEYNIIIMVDNYVVEQYLWVK